MHTFSQADGNGEEYIEVKMTKDGKKLVAVW